MSEIVVLGVPTALGGNLPGEPSPAGMAASPAGLRARGLLDGLRARGASVTDAGDLPIDPGYREDPDPQAKNLAQQCEFLPRERARVAELVGDERRLFVLGGDCVAHAGAMAGLRVAHPGARLAIVWFDAHGDFNDPTTTPSGNVWGMPFAMITGRGSDELLAACDGPSVVPRDAALVGGQALDEVEGRLLAASGVAHFGPGMLGGPAGLAALAGWAGSLAGSVDALYLAMDMDVLDGAAGWAVQLPEPGGVSLETATEVVRTLAASIPVVGFGATTVNLDRPGADTSATAAAVETLAAAAFGLEPTRG